MKDTTNGEILLGGKCPFVRKKKLCGQKIICLRCQCPQTKKWSGQKNYLSALQMPSVFLSSLFSVHLALVHIFGPIVQQGHSTYFRNSLQLLRNIMGLNNHNLSHKTLKYWALWTFPSWHPHPFFVKCFPLFVFINWTRWTLRLGVDATSAIVSLLSLETSRHVATWGFPCCGNS